MLDMDYWVLAYELDAAKNQFKDAPRMMKAFEHWFGLTRFIKMAINWCRRHIWVWSIKVEWHMATVLKNGYLGRDLSGTGWGLKWDFIIVHESGHEWFANSITTNDIADMWVHEGFTNYSETLFTDYYYGKEAGNEYVRGSRENISNDIPVIGKYGVNKEGSGDMYYKAGNMLHMIRQIAGDEKFREMLRGLNKTFYHKTVTTEQVENFISTATKTDFSKVFDQYLRTVQIPTLEYKVDGYDLKFRYVNCVPGFDLPLKIHLKLTNGSSQLLNGNR